MKKVVLITGATDGIGKALAIALADEYTLVLCGRSEEKMRMLLQEVGESCLYHACFDITDDGIIYLENRFKNNMQEATDFITKFIP